MTNATIPTRFQNDNLWVPLTEYYNIVVVVVVDMLILLLLLFFPINNSRDWSILSFLNLHSQLFLNRNQSSKSVLNSCSYGYIKLMQNIASGKILDIENVLSHLPSNFLHLKIPKHKKHAFNPSSNVTKIAERNFKIATKIILWAKHMQQELQSGKMLSLLL